MVLLGVPACLVAQGLHIWTDAGLWHAGRGAQGSSAMYTLSSLTQHWESLKYASQHCAQYVITLLARLACLLHCSLHSTAIICTPA